MIAFTLTEWIILILIFILGLLVGMFLMAGGKWKTRYREEARRREELETERDRLVSERKHWEAQHIAASAREDRPIA